MTSGAVAFALGLLFIGLKLTGQIAWSWWWVTLPFWGPAALFMFAFSVYCVCIALAEWLDRRARTRPRPSRGVF